MDDRDVQIRIEGFDYLCWATHDDNGDNVTIFRRAKRPPLIEWATR
jgi:hypothetical protein